MQSKESRYPQLLKSGQIFEFVVSNKQREKEVPDYLRSGKFIIIESLFYEDHRSKHTYDIALLGLHELDSNFCGLEKIFHLLWDRKTDVFSIWNYHDGYTEISYTIEFDINNPVGND